MKHESQGTFLGGVGDLNVASVPLAEWRIEPVTKDVRRAFLFLPKKFLGIHRREECHQTVAALEHLMEAAERDGVEGVDLQLPFPDPSEPVDAVHYVIGRKAVDAAATFPGYGRVRAVPIPVGYTQSPFPSGYQCSVILRKDRGWRSLFASSGFFEGGDPSLRLESVKRGQVLTFLNERDLGMGGLRELEHGDRLSFRNVDAKADTGAAGRLMYLEDGNLTFLPGRRVLLLLLDHGPLAEARAIGAEEPRPRWLRRHEGFRINGKEAGYGGFGVDGDSVAAAGGCILIGSSAERLQKAVDSEEHGLSEAIVVPHAREQGVSGIHARIRFDEKGASIEDLASKSGSWRYDGTQFVRLAGPVPLQRGDILSLGALQVKALLP